MPSFTRSRHTAVCPMVRVICVTTGYFLSSLCQISSPLLQLSASLTLLLIHLVTSVTAAATDKVTIAPQNCQMIENNLFRWWPVDKKYAGGRRLCYISTSIPVILEFISIETWSQTVYLKDLWVKRPDENRISEMTLEFYKEHHFSTHSRS